MNIKEQIKAEIERRKLESNMEGERFRYRNSQASQYHFGRRDALKELLSYINSLPEEKPSEKKPTCKTCGFYENNCPFIRGKFIPYPSRVCKDYTYSVMKEQEQPVEGLEKAETWLGARRAVKVLNKMNLGITFYGNLFPYLRKRGELEGLCEKRGSFWLYDTEGIADKVKKGELKYNPR